MFFAAQQFGRPVIAPGVRAGNFQQHRINTT
jgi:hypothetical protein